MSIGNIRISDKEIDKGKLMKYNVLRKEDAQHEQNQRIAERKEYHGCRTGKRTEMCIRDSPHNPQGLSFVHIQTDVTAGSQYLFSRRGKLLYNMVCL